jgi:hypothetical protein
LGIQKIKLGPKSRFSPDVPAEVQEAVDQVLAAAPREAFVEAAVQASGWPETFVDHPSVEVGGLGCACGRQLLPTREATWEHQGVVHRHGLPCYRKGESKQLGALPVVGAATPEPPPAPGRANVLDDLVVLLRERSDFGLRKYGTRLETFNGRDAHLDLLQELLDLFVYAHQAHMERAELERENAALRAKVAAACCGKGGCAG